MHHEQAIPAVEKGVPKLLNTKGSFLLVYLQNWTQEALQIN